MNMSAVTCDLNGRSCVNTCWYCIQFCGFSTICCVWLTTCAFNLLWLCSDVIILPHPVLCPVTYDTAMARMPGVLLIDQLVKFLQYLVEVYRDISANLLSACQAVMVMGYVLTFMTLCHLGA